MSQNTKPQKQPYKVTSAFVWEGKIRKPSDKDPVELTKTEAHGLKERGKVEDMPEAKGKTAAKDEAKSEGAKG